jgi:hypothetical protein
MIFLMLLTGSQQDGQHSEAMPVYSWVSAGNA